MPLFGAIARGSTSVSASVAMICLTIAQEQQRRSLSVEVAFVKQRLTVLNMFYVRFSQWFLLIRIGDDKFALGFV